MDWPLVIALLITAILGIGGILLIKRAPAVPVGSCLALLGLSGTGKTTLFYLLGRGEAPPSVSSYEIQRANANCSEIKKGLLLVDIPGHENFKADAVNSLASAKGGVFLVDTRNKEQIYKSALFLYDLFISKAVQKLNTSLLIVSNFQDSSESLSGDKLREELEREFDRIKTSRKAFEAGSSLVSDYIKEKADRFSFDSVQGLRVSFAGCCLSKGDYTSVKEFIQKQVKY